MTLAGIIPAPSIRTLSQTEREKIKDTVIALHGDGLGAEDIAAAVGFHEEWCRRVINKWRADQINAGTKRSNGQ